MFVKPWSKESENILRQLGLNNGKAYSHNTKLPVEFGKKCSELFEMDFLDVATIRNKREKKSIFVTPPDVVVIPKPGGRGVNFHFKRFKIL